MIQRISTILNAQAVSRVIDLDGIHSTEDAMQKLAAGADLLYVYTGFVYEGPGLVKGINKRILARK